MPGADAHALLPSRSWASPRVHALATLRHGAGCSLPPFDGFNLGTRCGDDPAAVRANRAQLRELAGLPAPPHWLRQVHGSGVHRFDAPAGEGGSPALDDDANPADAGRAWPAGAEPEADAAVTAVAGVVLAVLTADCLPVVLAAMDGSEVAVAHAGWRGLAGGVLEATLAAMHTPADRLQAWLGPAAGPHHYEVGAEVRTALLAGAPVEDASAFCATRAGHWHVDLYALARQRLARAGVVDVAGGDRCTITESQAFFSHRRDGRGGRMATLAWIAPGGAVVR